LYELLGLVRDLSILVAPYIPASAQKIASFFGMENLTWADLNRPGAVKEIRKPEILFTRLEDKLIQELRDKFSGSQKERQAEKEKAAASTPASAANKESLTPAAAPPVNFEEQFRQKVSLRAAKITAITRHPEADKLYIETISLGDSERQIVSGLVPYYKEEELLGHTIILAANLKPAKLRGTVSQGMLLAADYTGPGGEHQVEVLFADHAQPGEAVLLQNESAAGESPPSAEPPPPEIKVEAFFEIPIKVKDHQVLVGQTPLCCAGKPLITRTIKEGDVG
jgi:methionyl-tRNA synthetase